MLVGHIAVGLAAKRITPRVSVGTTVAAAVLPDLLWCTFLLAGIEHVELKPGRGAVNYFGASDIALSHSLLMDAICVSRGLLLRASLCPRRLDAVRRRDEPLGAGFRGSLAGYGVGAGVHRYFGLGLWNSVAATVIVEGGMWVAAIVLYVRATRAKGRTASPDRRRLTFAQWRSAA
jgi:hypothetical protein